LVGEIFLIINWGVIVNLQVDDVTLLVKKRLFSSAQVFIFHLVYVLIFKCYFMM